MRKRFQSLQGWTGSRKPVQFGIGRPISPNQIFWTRSPVLKFNLDFTAKALIITTTPSLSLALPPESCKVFGAAQLPDALAACSCAQRACTWRGRLILAVSLRCLCPRRAQRRQRRAPSAAAPVLQWRRMPHRRRRQSLPIHPLDARSMTGFARRPLVRRPRCASSAALPGRNASL